jgi:hypothetical protein
MSRRVDRTREERQRRAEIRNEIARAVAGIEGGGGSGVTETRVREIIDEEIVDGQAIDAAIDTLIAAETHLTQANIEAIITAELAAGQSIDNAIDALISAHLSGADHLSTTDVEGVITAELVDGQSIDLAIDSLIATHLSAADHPSTTDIENVIDFELTSGQSINQAILNEIGDHVADVPHGPTREKVNVCAVMGSTQQTLTGSNVVVTMDGTNSTFSTNFGSSFSVSGGVITFADNDAIGSITMEVTVSVTGKHTADDGRPMEYRVDPYYGATPSIYAPGIIYGLTGVANQSNDSRSRTFQLAIADGDTFEVRAKYANSAAGDGGFLEVFGSYSHSGSTDITTSAATVAYDTTDDSDSNLTLNVDGSVSVAVGGVYTVSYALPVNDDGTAGATRGAITALLEYDANDDGAGYVAVPQSYDQDYARETSGGQGVGNAFPVRLAAGSRIRVRVSTSLNVDVSTETGLAALSLVRTPAAEDGSQSGAIAAYGCIINMREV